MLNVKLWYIKKDKNCVCVKPEDDKKRKKINVKWKKKEMLIVTLELSKRRGNARVIKILLNVSKISRECIPLPLRSCPDLRLKTSLSENGMKLISRLERWCCYDLSSMIVFDLPSSPLIEKVIHQVDALNPRFSVSASTDTFPVGEKTMTHKQNQAALYWKCFYDFFELFLHVTTVSR